MLVFLLQYSFWRTEKHVIQPLIIKGVYVCNLFFSILHLLYDGTKCRNQFSSMAKWTSLYIFVGLMVVVVVVVTA